MRAPIVPKLGNHSYGQTPITIELNPNAFSRPSAWVDFENARKSAMPRATHYDYEAPGDADRTAVTVDECGFQVDALGAALAAMQTEKERAEMERAQQRRGHPEAHVIYDNGEDDEEEQEEERAGDEEGGVSEAALLHTREALSQMRAELLTVATAVGRAEGRQYAAAAKAGPPHLNCQHLREIT